MTAAMFSDPEGRALVAAIHERKHQAHRPPERNTMSEDALAAGCTCTNHCPEDYDDNDCAHCRGLDIYDPCPVVGFGCGLDCGDDEHCTPEQQKAADS